jgi:hypothetical protein
MLTRKALMECRDSARESIENAPPDGMLAFLIESVPESDPGYWNRTAVEVIAIAYARALQIHGRP